MCRLVDFLALALALVCSQHIEGTHTVHTRTLSNFQLGVGGGGRCLPDVEARPTGNVPPRTTTTTNPTFHSLFLLSYSSLSLSLSLQSSLCRPPFPYLGGGGRLLFLPPSLSAPPLAAAETAIKTCLCVSSRGHYSFISDTMTIRPRRKMGSRHVRSLANIERDLLELGYTSKKHK